MMIEETKNTKSLVDLQLSAEREVKMDNIALKKMNKLENAFIKWRDTEAVKDSDLINKQRMAVGFLAYAMTVLIFIFSGIVDDMGNAIALSILLTVTGVFPALASFAAFVYKDFLYPIYSNQRFKAYLKIEREIFQSKNGISTILNAVDEGVFMYKPFIKRIHSEINYRIEEAKKFRKNFKDYYPENNNGISEIAKSGMRITELQH